MGEDWYGFPIQSTNSAWVDNGKYLTSWQSDEYPKMIPEGATGQFFSAPLMFRGHQSHSNEGVLRFQLKSCAGKPEYNYPEGDIIIKGHRWELVTSLPYAPSAYWWTQYDIRLNEGPKIEIEVSSDASCNNEISEQEVLYETCTYMDHTSSYGWIRIQDSITAEVRLFSDAGCTVQVSSATVTNGVCGTGNVKYSWDRNQFPVPGWRVRPEGQMDQMGTRATAAEIANVLSYVKCINIRSRFSHVKHYSELDNVMLCDGVHPVFPCPGFSDKDGEYKQCSGHGTCKETKCECDHGWEGDDCSKKVKCDIRKWKLPDNIRKWKTHDESVVNPQFLV